MSLELSKSTPKITVKTGFKDVILLYSSNINIEIPMDDFCYLVEYVLTNTDLIENDPRLTLIKNIKNMHEVEGYNPGNKHLNY